MYNKYILICLNLFYKILILIITLIIYISVIIKNYFNKEDREKIISNHTYLDKNIYNREYHKLDNDIDLYSYINHKNFNWSIKNIILNIFQGCIYDMLLDENAYFSKYIWLGNHERGILHEECKLIIRKFLIKDLIQKKKFHKIKILDIGCGTCKSIVDLDKLLRFNNIKAEFYGCDISPDILREGIINLKETID